jgi:hypothetical protein
LCGFNRNPDSYREQGFYAKGANNFAQRSKVAKFILFNFCFYNGKANNVYLNIAQGFNLGRLNKIFVMPILRPKVETLGYVLK